MQIEICKWKNNKNIPLIFMIDDLANIYFHRNHGDWGGLLDREGSMYRYLKKNILSNYPELKFTFFTVAGVRSNQVYGSYDHVADCSESAFSEFLKLLSNDGHEVCYHGLTHGAVEKRRFIQEWDTFKSADEAAAIVNKGLMLLSGAVEKAIYGGKYCGYRPGKYGHESIKRNRVKWWFDSWDSDHLRRPLGEFKDGILYLPSNIDCSDYTFGMFAKVPFLKYLKSVSKRACSKSLNRKILELVASNGIISLQEHSSPIRTDGKTQFPNIVHDLPQILSVLEIVSQHSPWYATASDVYNYTLFREKVCLIKERNEYSLVFTGSPTEAQHLLEEDAVLSLKLSRDTKASIFKEVGGEGASFQIINVGIEDVLTGKLTFKRRKQ